MTSGDERHIEGQVVELGTSVDWCGFLAGWKEDSAKCYRALLCATFVSVNL